MPFARRDSSGCTGGFARHQTAPQVASTFSVPTGLAMAPPAALLMNAGRHGDGTRSQCGLVLLQRFPLLRGLEDVTLRHLTVPRRRMELRQLAPSRVQRVEEERQQHEDRTRDAR